MFSSMASKPITIRWIRTGSQPYWKIMYSIVLQIVFHETSYQNHKIPRALGPFGANKTDFNLKIFQFDIRGKLSIIRCEKYMLQV